MIGSIRGEIILKTDKFLVVDAAGVGYKVSVPEDLIVRLTAGEEIMLWIYTHVREDTLDLYGFVERTDLEFFEMLLGVSGIGPRSALGILGVAPIETLRKAIGTGDTSYLTKISGIGKKTAEKIIVELRDKIGATEGPALKEELDALEALTSLGYSQQEAREALKKISADTTNAKIKEALKMLGGK